MTKVKIFEQTFLDDTESFERKINKFCQIYKVKDVKFAVTNGPYLYAMAIYEKRE